MDKYPKTALDELEDGEIEFDASFDDIYTPLERPTCNAQVPIKPIVESDLDDNDNSSSEDSDSSCGGISGPKIKKNSKLPKLDPRKPKKHNLKIWCNVLEDEAVSNNLTSCNLDEYQMKIRGLLPYTSGKFNYKNSFKRNGDANSGKRNHRGHYINEKKYFKENKANIKKGTSKCIPPLPDHMWDSDELLAKEIADKLNEVKINIILKAIQIAGKQKIISIFEETRKTEKSGGMLIMNGSRRRTSGGVFFYLLKTFNEIPQEQLKQIFQIDKKDTSNLKRTVNQDQHTAEITDCNR